MSKDIAERDRVEARIRDVVCPVCPFRTRTAACATHDPEGCAILRNLDQVIDVVRTIRSDRIDDYVERLREVVCAECRNQDSEGRCKVRDRIDCSLDCLFGLVVETVESELSRIPAA